jgi:type 1 glutamine amidotransferase
VLVFSRTAGFRHGSIPAGVKAVEALGERHGFAVDATEDPAKFKTGHLGRYAAVVFMNTTGDVLDDTQQAAFESYIRAGGGFVGVHAATDTEYDWPWYGKMVGARFLGHPAVQTAVIEVIDRDHLSTAHLPEHWSRTDEWYDFTLVDVDRRVLARLDESSYEGGKMGDDHPFAWCHEFDGGRAWYTAGGHTDACFTEPAFLAHLLGGIRWAGQLAPEREAERLAP